jgi:hypothetical protein
VLLRVPDDRDVAVALRCLVPPLRPHLTALDVAVVDKGVPAGQTDLEPLRQALHGSPLRRILDIGVMQEVVVQRLALGQATAD